MIEVTEQVFENGELIHTSKKEWGIKSRFINEFKKLSGVSSYVAAELNRNNRVEIEQDGLKRVIEIQPRIEIVK